MATGDYDRAIVVEEKGNAESAQPPLRSGEQRVGGSWARGLLVSAVLGAVVVGACKEVPLRTNPIVGDSGTDRAHGSVSLEAGTERTSQVPSGPTGRPMPTSPVLAPVDAGEACNSEHALDLYDQKIAPLFADEQPSTCGQCHLPGVDLEMFVRGTPCETLACLVDRRLVNPSSPADSKLLDWIGRAEPDSDLITAEVIAAERDAFEQWISYSITCGTCAGSVCPDADAGAKCSLQSEPGAQFDPTKIDPGGCSDRALEAVFRETVYAHRGRCSPCHFADHDDEEAPQWIEVSFGCEEASRRTLKNVVDHGYVDTKNPSSSLLLLKPLSEDQGGLKHGGGDKFDGLTDEGYESFRYFVDRYVECASAK
jgi:hypothetical protein